MSFTYNARLLLKDIPENFPVGFEKAWVGLTPEKLMGSIESDMALMAISTSSPTGTHINMRMPSITRALHKLAGEGPGHNVECNGVRFQFVELADGRLGVSMGLEEL